MIKVTTKNGLDLFISLFDDVDPNKGGYYCEVYLEAGDCLNIDIISSSIKTTWIASRIDRRASKHIVKSMQSILMICHTSTESSTISIRKCQMLLTR